MAPLLAVVAAALFGALAVALRQALRRHPDAELGTLATIAVACAVAAVAAAVKPGGAGGGTLGLLALAGLLAPGASQLLFTLAVREAGPSRASAIVGAAPLLAVTIAIVALNEPVRAGLLAGTVLVVAGAVALGLERDRPAHVRRIGLVCAVAATGFFATRDNLVRWTLSGRDADPRLAAVVSIASGGMLVLVTILVRRRTLAGFGRAAIAFAPAGLLFGLSYVLLFEAYDHGRVGVVSPIIATETLWGVALAALLVRGEGVGARVAGSALLIVAGAALIGAFR